MLNLHSPRHTPQPATVAVCRACGACRGSLPLWASRALQTQLLHGIFAREVLSGDDPHRRKPRSGISWPPVERSGPKRDTNSGVQRKSTKRRLLHCQVKLHTILDGVGYSCKWKTKHTKKKTSNPSNKQLASERTRWCDNSQQQDTDGQTALFLQPVFCF